MVGGHGRGFSLRLIPRRRLRAFPLKTIHQFVAGFSNGDAISNEARALRGHFAAWGCGAALYCEHRRVLPELRAEVRDPADAAAAARPDDVALLHLSIGSDVNDLFAALPCRKAVIYHNISPPDFYRGVNDATARCLARGREQAARLAGAAEVALADSRYNAAELEGWGYRNVGVLPLVLDFTALDAAPDRAVRRAYDDGRLTALFVGRCAPNKRIEDLLAAFYYLQRYIEPGARLLHVGSAAGTERYQALLWSRSRDLGLSDYRPVGAAPPRALLAYYRRADVFLCLSEHEGFCIPLLEAMHLGVPVLAYAAGAVEETMDGAGVLFREKRFDLIAETIARVTRDAALRRAIIAAQHARIARYRAADPAALLRRALAPLLGRAP